MCNDFLFSDHGMFFVAMFKGVIITSLLLFTWSMFYSCYCFTSLHFILMWFVIFSNVFTLNRIVTWHSLVVVGCLLTQAPVEQRIQKKVISRSWLYYLNSSVTNSEMNSVIKPHCFTLDPDPVGIFILTQNKKFIKV